MAEEEVEPFTVVEVQKLLRAASESRNSARWALALALGLRQGEALGLQWSDVDIEARLLVVRRNRLRPKYARGCRPPCGRKYAGHCPQREQIRADADETKSTAGRRVVGLPNALCRIVEEQRVAPARERLHAGRLSVDGGWLFTNEVGASINPRTDWDEWKKLLKTADVRDGRLHDARHTAATVLLMLGASEQTIMGLMGWSTPR